MINTSYVLNDYSNVRDSERKFRVFISYAREDEIKAKRFYEDLKNSGIPIEPWFDKEDLLPGQDYNIRIIESIKKSDFFIPLFSLVSVEKRGYIQREFNLAVDTLKDIPPGDIFVIPVRLDECEIKYEEIKKYQRQDLFPDWHIGLSKIIRSIQNSIEKVSSRKMEKKQIDGPRKYPELDSDELLEQKVPKIRDTLQFIGEKRIFVGREDYLDYKLKNAIIKQGTRVSLVGPGGSGKSQLAFKALHQYYENEKYKIVDLVVPLYLYVVVTGSANENENIKAISISFKRFLNDIGFYLIDKGIITGISKQQFERIDENAARSFIYDTFSKKNHPVLYCDNFETLSSVGTLIDKEIRYIFNFLNNELPSNTSILITSRNRRNFIGEEVIDLEGLSVEEGIELFSENASAYRQHLENKSDTRLQGLLRKIITKTNGHPLSIEILAKTYEGRGTSELEVISETLGRKRDDPLASEERLQSLHKSFGYSIDKLNSDIQQLLPLLTIFHSPFPSSAVKNIFGLQEVHRNSALENTLSDLYNKSLLSRIEADQYGPINDRFWVYTLHPAIRNYLEDKYKKDIARVQDEIIPYFCNYYYSLIEETYCAWGKDDHLDFLRRFDIISKVDDNDFDRAIEFAVNSGEQKPGKEIGAKIAMYLGHMGDKIGFYEEAFGYYKKALAIHEELKDRRGMAQNYANIGRVYRYKGLYDEALDYHNKALVIHEELNDRVGIAENYAKIGEVYRNKGLYDEALDYHNKALVIHEKLKDWSGMGRDYTYIGAVYRYKGLYDEAIDYHNKALVIHEKMNDKVGMEVNYARIGMVYSSNGFYDEALTFLLNALQIDEELKGRVRLAVNYGRIGVVYRYKGLYEQALDYHKKSLAIHEELKDSVGIAVNYGNIGGTYRDSGLYEQALDYHKKSLAIHEELKDSVGIAVNYTNIGIVYRDRGFYDEALDYLKKSLTIDEELNDRLGMAINYARIGEVYRDKGLYEEAIAYHKKALAIDEEIQSKWRMATDYLHFGEVYRDKGLYEEAIAYHKKALVIHEETKDIVGMAINYAKIGEVYRDKGLYEEAIAYHKKALAIHEELKDRVNLALDHYLLSLIYIKKKMEKETKEALGNAFRIMDDFKKDTGYRHPFVDTVERIN